MESGLLVFARDPQGKSTVIVCPDQVMAQELIAVLEAEGWYIQDPTFSNDIEFVPFAEDDDDD